MGISLKGFGGGDSGGSGTGASVSGISALPPQAAAVRLPPTEAFPTQGPVVTDPYWNNVVLRMTMEDNTDYKGHTVLNTNTTFSNGKFTNAGTFNGAAGLDTTSSTDFDFSTSDFTAECWLKTTDTGSYKTILGSWDYSLNKRSWNIYLMSGNLGIFTSANGTLTGHAGTIGSTTVNDGNWHHVAYVRSGSTHTIFVDGVADVTTSYGNVYAGDRLSIGYTFTVSESLTGQIDDVRVTKGIAHYTANFTPPTEAFPTS